MFGSQSVGKKYEISSGYANILLGDETDWRRHQVHALLARVHLTFNLLSILASLMAHTQNSA